MNPKNFHEDEETRIESERCAAIVIKDDKVLMIHRIKDNFEYFVFPGGHRRIDEDPGDVVIREVKEETNIDVANPKLVFEFKNHHANWHHPYFLCECEDCSEPKLVGEEAVRHCEENQYYPKWIPLSEIPNLNVLPLFAKEWLVDEIVKKSSFAKASADEQQVADSE